MFELWSGLENSRQEMEEFRVSADVKFQRAKGRGCACVPQSEFRITEKDVWTEAQNFGVIGV